MEGKTGMFYEGKEVEMKVKSSLAKMLARCPSLLTGRRKNQKMIH